ANCPVSRSLTLHRVTRCSGFNSAFPAYFLHMASITQPPTSPPQEEVDINLNDPQVGEAAKKIQNVFRSKRMDKKSNATSNNTNESTAASG
ncbi:hypothetical protein V3C99_011438, partial [Haemonchus contortus]|uniref:Purkinje cell protein 2 n=1 Tax=Haemonchus contortus TaxID=6289 RepID=A0A7I4Z8T7_HAECO